MEDFGQESDAITMSKVTSFFGYILLFGGIFMLWFAIQDTRQAIEAKSWEGKKARITSSDVFFNSSGGTRGWKIDIRGKFLDDGKEFETSRIKFGEIFVGGKSELEETAAKFPAGSVHTVFVSPKNANQVVLLRNESPILANRPLLICGGMIVLSVLLLWASKKLS